MKFDLDFCIGNRLRCLSRIVDNEFRSKLKQFEITENQLSILFVLSKLGDAEQGKIGEILFLERSTVSRNVKLLEKRQIVTKTTDYHPVISLSEKGTDLLEQIVPVWESIMDKLVEKLDDEGLQDLVSLEERLK